MSEDVIKVSLDSTELDIEIAKAKQLISLYTQMTGKPDIVSGIKKPLKDTMQLNRLLEETSSESVLFLRQVGEADLPGVNRELRLILGQIPGMRMLIADYFRLKRIQRSVGIATEEAKVLRDVLTNPQLILTMVATLIIVMKSITNYFEKVKREKLEYEEFLRREKGLTRREFESMFDKVGGGAGARKQYFWSLPG